MIRGRFFAFLLPALLSIPPTTHAILPDDEPLRFITGPELQKLIREHRSGALVVNIWATWCVPCVEEVPDLVKLSADGDVRVIGVSIDDPEDSASKVAPFLKKKGVPYPVFIKASGNDEGFINSLNEKWTGAVPATFIYDARGRQRAMLVGKQSYSSMREAVDAIKQKAANSRKNP
jgi:thiol-disulfide isomerase/thioredoxin